MKSLESYNLFDPETAENPFEYYEALRREAPVYKMPMGMYIVSSPGEVLARECCVAQRTPGRLKMAKTVTYKDTHYKQRELIP